MRKTKTDAADCAALNEPIDSVLHLFVVGRRVSRSGGCADRRRICCLFSRFANCDQCVVERDATAVVSSWWNRRRRRSLQTLKHSREWWRRSVQQWRRSRA